MTGGEGLAMTKKRGVCNDEKESTQDDKRPLEINTCAGIIEEASFAERLG